MGDDWDDTLKEWARVEADRKAMGLPSFSSRRYGDMEEVARLLAENAMLRDVNHERETTVKRMEMENARLREACGAAWEWFATAYPTLMQTRQNTTIEALRAALGHHIGDATDMTGKEGGNG